MKDWIDECNSERVPEEDFRRVWCQRCRQDNCSRSLVNGGGFAHRTNTWRERLFDDPKTLSESDPRHALVTAVKFVEIQSQGASVSSDWSDPRELDKTESAVQGVSYLKIPQPPPQMIGEGVEKSPTRWVTPAPVPAKVVQPGAEITFGSKSKDMTE